MSEKPSNPKDIVGIRKLAFSVLPWQVLARVALAMLEGASKYGRHNYRAVGVRASVYFDAVVGRHLTDWWEGTDIDPDSDLHHVDKAIAGLFVLRDSMLQGNFVDDRPPRAKLDMVEMNKLAGAIIDRHADKNPRHYTIADSEEIERDQARRQLNMLEDRPPSLAGELTSAEKLTLQRMLDSVRKMREECPRAQKPTVFVSPDLADAARLELGDQADVRVAVVGRANFVSGQPHPPKADWVPIEPG